MRENFPPNLRLTTNPFLVIDIFLIAFNLSELNNKQRKIDCADTLAGCVISYNNFSNNYKIGIFDNKKENFYRL
tara:strand:+ start:184 stop:405 length:222 start_codon:yes stop_codon:yes gene_type:complete